MRTSLLLLLLANCCQAETLTFGEGEDSFEIEFVQVGSPGNADDMRRHYQFDGNGRPSVPYFIGGVDYEFSITKFELSCDALARVSAIGGIPSVQRPFCPAGVNGSSPAIATREETIEFVNWLNTNSGFSPAYKTIVSPESYAIVDWDEGDTGYSATDPTRNQLARFFIANADEFHKSAYYDPVAESWLDYATEGNVRPLPVPEGMEAGTAVVDRSRRDLGGFADVDDAGGLSAFETMGQTGNAPEWEEGFGWFRGGVGAAGSLNLAFASNGRVRVNAHATAGFRVVAVTPVPESSSPGLLVLCSLGAFCRRLRPCC